jgi:hypothetical protein
MHRHEADLRERVFGATGGLEWRTIRAGQKRHQPSSAGGQMLAVENLRITHWPKPQGNLLKHHTPVPGPIWSYR